MDGFKACFCPKMAINPASHPPISPRAEIDGIKSWLILKKGEMDGLQSTHTIKLEI
jgi:hypothetical protein